MSLVSRWFHAGRLPVPARRVGRLILVRDATAEPVQHRRTAVYARVSSADQISVDKVVTEVGSALNGHRRKFLALLRDPTVSRIVVKHRIVSAGSDLSMSKPRSLCRAASWSWSTPERSTMIWCVI